MSRTINPVAAPTFAWLALLALTFIGLGLGGRWHSAPGLPLLVAGIIWLKSMLVARYFIESHLAHPFIGWLLRVFIAFAPAALVLSSFFSP